MNRLWSLLFLLTPILGIGLFVGAAFRWAPLGNLWLPESIGPRSDAIDGLFNLIHVILGVVFALTGLVLAIALWRFDGRRTPRAKSFRSNVPLELLWTIVPAGILLFLSLYQVQIWNADKVHDPYFWAARGGNESELQPPFARVVARQFGWRFVYPGPDLIFDTPDDVFWENELVVPAERDIVLELVSQDVIHSLFVPSLRLKQDAVPGLRSRVWFSADRLGATDIVCAELCGWGHYKMHASLIVVSENDYQLWIDDLTRRQHLYQVR